MENTNKQTPDKINPNLIRPLEIVNNFEYSDENKFNPPFASKAEAFGFLSGGEHEVLVTRSEPIYGYAFVQCAGALIRNRDTGLIFSLHESTWSDAADIIMAAQRPNNLDVITMDGARGTMRISDIVGTHKVEMPRLTHLLKNVKHGDAIEHRFPKGGIRGITGSDLDSMIKKSSTNIKSGGINYLGKIDLKSLDAGMGRWYMLYRPTENVIRIYDQSSQKLFKFPGFNLR